MNDHDQGTQRIQRSDIAPDVATPVPVARREGPVASAQRQFGNAFVTRALRGGEGVERVVAARVAGEAAGLVGEGEDPNGTMQVALHRSAPGPVEADIPTGAGRPLPDGVRVRMERAFGHDFDHVRIHTDAAAARAAHQLAAHAFALGADVFFGQGSFAPGTARGDTLIAHELTHVVQHDEGRLPQTGGITRPTDPVEQEAYANEARIVALLPSIDAVLADPVQCLDTGPEGPMPPAVAQRVASGLGVARDAEEEPEDDEQGERAALRAWLADNEPTLWELGQTDHLTSFDRDEDGFDHEAILAEARDELARLSLREVFRLFADEAGAWDRRFRDALIEVAHTLAVEQPAEPREEPDVRTFRTAVERDPVDEDEVADAVA